MRDARGMNNGNSVLTDQEVWDIRAANLLCRVSQMQLAREHDVSQKVVSGIVLRKTWRHLLPAEKAT